MDSDELKLKKRLVEEIELNLLRFKHDNYDIRSCIINIYKAFNQNEKKDIFNQIYDIIEKNIDLKFESFIP